MKKKELKKIKKIIGVLSGIVQEHEGREARVRWENSIVRPKEEVKEYKKSYALEVRDKYFLSLNKRKRGETKIMPFSTDKVLGNRRVGKIGIVIVKDSHKTILSHPILYNYVGGTIPLYQDETGYFVLHSEEKVYLHE